MSLFDTFNAEEDEHVHRRGAPLWVVTFADMVVLLHRPDAFENDDPRAGEADLILAKHRNGPTTTITVAHQLHYSRFSDLAHG